MNNHAVKMEFSVVIPTYNGGELFKECIAAIKAQIVSPKKVVVIDSSSSDGSDKIARDAGFEVIIIPKSDFDHGGTRTKSLEYVSTPVVFFLTQDAILQNIYSFENLLHSFIDESVGAAYGRQLPHLDANIMAKHARVNSYKEQSYIASINSTYPKGLRKAFLSNSFSGYRVELLNKMGSFPSKLILGEDSFIATKLLINGYKVVYNAHALVRHSHNYTILEEFRRYFDIGVFHQSEKWMLDILGTVEGEGIKFAIDQLKFVLSSKKPWMIIKSGLSSLFKFIGYRLGRGHKSLSKRVCCLLSMHKGYWST